MLGTLAENIFNILALVNIGYLRLKNCLVNVGNLSKEILMLGQRWEHLKNNN
jgi:hypothetical protein